MSINRRLEAFRTRDVPQATGQYVERNLKLVNRVADRLQELGWSQEEFARRLGKRPSQVSKWMTGLQNMTLLTISEIENVIGVDLLSVTQETPYGKTGGGPHGRDSEA